MHNTMTDKIKDAKKFNLNFNDFDNIAKPNEACAFCKSDE